MHLILSPANPRHIHPGANYVQSSPAIGEDGVLYIGSGDKSLYAINPDGTKKWSYATGKSTCMLLSVTHMHLIFSPANPRHIHTGGAITSSPAIGADGVVYIGSSLWFYAIGVPTLACPGSQIESNYSATQLDYTCLSLSDGKTGSDDKTVSDDKTGYDVIVIGSVIGGIGFILMLVVVMYFWMQNELIITPLPVAVEYTCCGCELPGPPSCV